MSYRRALSPEQFAGGMGADSIDILVALNGYTRGGRSHVLALRPAPIQGAYVGYPTTLGGTLADYFVADGTAAPPPPAVFFAENIARPPPCHAPVSHPILPVPPEATRSCAGPLAPTPA